MHLKEQSVKKQVISRYYFSIASIQSSKESSNYNKIVCFAGVNDTGNAPEKSNISVNIRKKLKSLLGLSTGARRRCLKKKTRGIKSGGTVLLMQFFSHPFGNLPRNLGKPRRTILKFSGILRKLIENYSEKQKGLSL
jgi:hypothetical protein